MIAPLAPLVGLSFGVELLEKFAITVAGGLTVYLLIQFWERSRKDGVSVDPVSAIAETEATSETMV